jgi:hypothetical protein
LTLDLALPSSLARLLKRVESLEPGPISVGAQALRQAYQDQQGPSELQRNGIRYGLSLLSQERSVGVINGPTVRLFVGNQDVISFTLGSKNPLLGAFNQGRVSEGFGSQIYVDLGDRAGLVQTSSGQVRHTAGSDGQYGLSGGIGILNAGLVSMGSGAEDRVVGFASRVGVLNLGRIVSSGAEQDALVVWGAGGTTGIDQRGVIQSRGQSRDQLLASAGGADAEQVESQLTGLSFLPGLGDIVEALRTDLLAEDRDLATVVALKNGRRAEIKLGDNADTLLAAAPKGALALRNNGLIDLGRGSDRATILGCFEGDGLIDFGRGKNDRLDLLPDATYQLSCEKGGVVLIEGLDAVARGSLRVKGLEWLGDQSVDSILMAGEPVQMH